MNTNKSQILKNLEAEYFNLLAKNNPSKEESFQMDILERAIKKEQGLPRPPKDIKLFGVAGKMKHGKDAFYELVKSIYPQARRMAFADALKKEVAAACGVTIEFINVNKDVFRPMLQWWGTEFRREICGDTYWLDRLDDTIRAIPDGSVVFVTDVRFPNEAEFVRQLGGSIVRVVRTNAPEGQSGQAAHASEMELEKINAEHTLCAASLEELTSITKMWWEKQKQ